MVRMLRKPSPGFVIALRQIGIMVCVDPERGEKNLEEQNRDRNDADRVEDLLRRGGGNSTNQSCGRKWDVIARPACEIGA